MERKWRKIYVFQEVKDTEKKEEIAIFENLLGSNMTNSNNNNRNNFCSSSQTTGTYSNQTYLVSISSSGRNHFLHFVKLVESHGWCSTGPETRIGSICFIGETFPFWLSDHFLTLIRKTLHKQGWTKKMPSEMEVVSCSTLLPLFLLFILFKLSTA